jgi:outer membrane receptor for ferric coprogen and ferric-rhodotorulic acid
MLELRTASMGSLLCTAAALFALDPATAAESGPPLVDEVIVRATRSAVTEGKRSYAAELSTVASKSAKSLRETPRSVTVVTHALLQDRNVTTASEALRLVPGATVRDGDGVNHSFFARGFDLEVQYDGLPSFASYAIPIADLVLFDRVEVLRGPAGVLNGRGTAGGVVNFVRKRPLDVFAVQGAAMLGSFDYRRVEGDVNFLPLTTDRLRLRLIGASQERDFYYDVADEQRSTLQAIAEVDLTGNTQLTLSAGLRDLEGTPFFGLPTSAQGALQPYPRSSFVGAAFNRSDQRGSEYTIGLLQSFGDDWLLNAEIRHADERFVQMRFDATSAPNPAGLSTFRHRGSDLEGLRTAGDMHVAGTLLALSRVHDLVVGFAFEDYDRFSRTGTVNVPLRPLFDHQVAEIPVPLTSYVATDVRGFGPYTQINVSLSPRLKLGLGGKLSRFVQDVATNAAPSFRRTINVSNEFSGSAGVVFDLSDAWTAYASYADTFYPQTTTSARGDTLPPVTGTQYEAGVKAILAAGRLRASAALFHLTEENRSQADPLNPGFSIPVGEIRSRGFEAEISGEPLTGLRLTAGYAYTDAIVVRAEVVGPEVPSLNGKRVANTPLHSIRGSMGYDFQTPALAAFSAGLGIQSGSEIVNLAPLNVIHQGGFTVLSAQLGYRINEVTNASLIVNNLTDKRYYQSLSTTTSGNYYGEPRNLQLVVRARF